MSALPNLIDYREPLATLPDNTQTITVACQPVSGSVFSPSSQIQVDLGNAYFLDPASLHIRYKVSYTGPADRSAHIVGCPLYNPFVRLETQINSNTVETVNSYNVVATMLTNLKMSVADKYGQQASHGWGSIAATKAAPLTMEALDGYISPLCAVGGAPLTVSQFVSGPLPCLLSNSEKLIPLFLLNNIRLIFTLDTLLNMQSAAGGAEDDMGAITISNFEVVYSAVNFGKEVENATIMMNPKLQIKSSSYSTAVQPVANNTTGTVNLVYNSRFASVKSAFLLMGGTDGTKSANRNYDSFDITSGNGDYQFNIGSICYPMRALSTTNNKGGILQELRRSMDSLYNKNNSLSINAVEWNFKSDGTTVRVGGADADQITTTTVGVPSKFIVSACLTKLTVPQKAFFMGVSTQSAPITVQINIGTPTAQAHNCTLVLAYEALIQVDTSSRQVTIVS